MSEKHVFICRKGCGASQFCCCYEEEFFKIVNNNSNYLKKQLMNSEQ